MTPAQAAESRAIAARARPRAAGDASPSATTRPPPLRARWARGFAANGMSSGSGVMPASAWTSVPSAASAACAGDTPSSISRRMSVSRARSAAV
jgi:hypothetical protein